MRIPVIVHPLITRRNQVELAISTINGHQNRVHLTMKTDEGAPILARDGSINPIIVRDKLVGNDQDIRGAIFITDCPFNDNWFSHTDVDGTIVTIAQWDELYAPPALRVFLQVEFIQHFIARLADLAGNSMSNFAHEQAIGCVFDFCSIKEDIRYKLIAGNICGHHSGLLRQMGMRDADIRAIQLMLDAMRSDALGRLEPIDQNKVFVAMRFSANDANDHAYRYGVVPAFSDLGLSAERGDQQAGPSQDSLIKKVFLMIDEAWAVVVLAGEENLNVFFEYGYAIGRQKPLYVVVPRSKMKSLPTDILGYEFIVFNDGDFEGLRVQIVRRLRQLPRFAK